MISTAYRVESHIKYERRVHMSIVLSQWERHLSVPNQEETNRNIIVLPLNQIVNINQQTAIGRETKDIWIKQIGTEFPSEVNLDFKALSVTFFFSIILQQSPILVQPGFVLTM